MNFNNLLTVVLGNLEGAAAMRGRHGGTGSGPRQRNARRRAGQRFFTEQLLAFAANSRSRPVVLDVNEIVLSMSDLLQAYAGEDHQRPFQCSIPRPG